MLSANFKKPIQNFSENKYTKIAVGVVTVLIPVFFLIASVIGNFNDFSNGKPAQFYSNPISSSIQYLVYWLILIYTNAILFIEKLKIGEFSFLLKITFFILIMLVINTLISLAVIFIL